MTKLKLLLIDDDQELSELLTEFLGSEGYALDCCYDGLSGLEKAKIGGYDLILLDVMMPGLNGFEVLKNLGDKHPTPILMLTAKGDQTDRVLGLELGADDYLAKPYNPQELLARIKAILRRVDILTNKSRKTPVLINNVQLNPATREVFCHHQAIVLTGTEFEMLQLLMESVDNIVSKEQLSLQVLNRQLMAFDRSIDMHISNIRRKLHMHSEDEKIKTIRAVGYVFISGESE